MDWSELSHELQFGSLLSYCPRGSSGEAAQSKDAMIALKKDTFVDDPPLLMSQWIANTLKRNKDILPLASYFKEDTTLVVPDYELYGFFKNTPESNVAGALSINALRVSWVSTVTG